MKGSIIYLTFVNFNVSPNDSKLIHAYETDIRHLPSALHRH